MGGPAFCKILFWSLGASLVAQTVKDLPAVQETQVQLLCWADPLEKGMATHSTILVWRVPWTGNLAGYSPWAHKESDTTEQLTLSFFHSGPSDDSHPPA